MTTFKAGDKVRVVNAGGSSVISEGGVYTVNHIYDDFVYIGSSTDGWLEDRFELVKPETILVGDRVVITENCAYGSSSWGKFGTVTEVRGSGYVYPFRVRRDGYDSTGLYRREEIRPVKVVKTKKSAIQVQAHVEGGSTPWAREIDLTRLFTELLASKAYVLRGKVTTNIYEYTETTEV